MSALEGRKIFKKCINSFKKKAKKCITAHVPLMPLGNNLNSSRLIFPRKLRPLKISNVERVEYFHTCEMKIKNKTNKNKQQKKSHWKKTVMQNISHL